LMADVVPSYKGFRYPVEIISHCVWLYHRFPLSLREVEEMMMERGIVVALSTCSVVRAVGARMGALSTW
jgi:putative transposase